MSEKTFPNIIDVPGGLENQTMCFMTDDRAARRKNFVDLRLLVDDKTVLKNPHKGWFWHFIDNGYGRPFYRDGYEDDPVLDFPGLNHLYLRFDWGDVEKEEGVYDFSYLDEIMEKWGAYGYTFALRVVTYEGDPNLNYATPAYVYEKGALRDVLAVSTGLVTEGKPYNETRSGEFILTSRVGTFRSDNLICGMAIRFNKGDLLHEVPKVEYSDGSTSYRSTEAKLGTKASHGCIRVQRKETPEGVNMAWIWNTVKNSSQIRLMIWEDWQGRQIEIPSDDFQLYYNPDQGAYYHSQETCSGTKEGIVLESFAYGQLEEEPFAKLKRCEYCAPALRRAEIEEINAKYVFGGDHDPVLTKAREKCPRPQK